MRVDALPGDPISVRLDLHVAAGDNRREGSYFSRVKRARREIGTVIRALRRWLHCRPELPLTIELHRVAWCALDSDNLVASFKSVRDGIAIWLGVNDRDPRLHWHYSQSLTRETKHLRHIGRAAAAHAWITLRAWAPRDGSDPLRVLAAGRAAGDTP